TLLQRGLWNVEDPIDPLLPCLSFMWTTDRAQLIAALKHRIAVIHGKVKALAFAIEHHDDPHSSDQVREMLRLASAPAAAEIRWAEALIATRERGDYTFAGERTAAEVRRQARDVAKMRRTEAPPRRRRKRG